MSNFCPAPWNSLFYHVDSASVCCVNKTRIKIAPKWFKETEFVKQLKENFLADKRPESCSVCWKAEEMGLQSIRQHMLKAAHDIESEYKHMELRASNLCNFSCVMCFPEDSSEIAKEVRSISDVEWQQIVEMTKSLNTLILTGGEPMLIKRYYDLLDNLNENIRLIIYTNCSVYNQKFIDKMLRIKKVKLQLSIDGIKETAERQRIGTDWGVVEKNVERYCRLPVEISIHATITKYNILDMVRYVDFLNSLLLLNDSITFAAHTVQWPEEMKIESLSHEETKTAIEQIDIALDKMGRNNFDRLRKEFYSLKKHLENLV